MSDLRSIIHCIENAICDEETSWWCIKQGYDDRYDEYFFQKQQYEWKKDEYENELRQELWSNAIKIKAHQSEGYIIEISKSSRMSIPEYFIPKQSLTQSTRYTTQNLQDISQHIIKLQWLLDERQEILLAEIYEKVSRESSSVLKIADFIKKVDFWINGVYQKMHKNYVFPTFNEKKHWKIVWWRHPVVESVENDFIENSLCFEREKSLHVITWPNMWWKSTFLRQNALITLIAHMGYPVPCESANIYITDAIFSRVGAQDNMFLWQSTFLLEMQEVSYILHHATKKSFIIIDEIGRGTSTYDWLSLAQSILLYIVETLWTKTLFATHYHELVDIAECHKNTQNFSVSVSEQDGKIIFLRKIIPGGVKKSYGIEVAKIAWLHPQIINHAKEILIHHEYRGFGTQAQLFDDWAWDTSQEDNNISEKNQAVLQELWSLDLEKISPLEALIKISELQKKLEK